MLAHWSDLVHTLFKQNRLKKKKKVIWKESQAASLRAIICHTGQRAAALVWLFYAWLGLCSGCCWSNMRLSSVWSRQSSPLAAASTPNLVPKEMCFRLFPQPQGVPQPSYPQPSQSSGPQPQPPTPTPNPLHSHPLGSSCRKILKKRRGLD